MFNLFIISFFAVPSFAQNWATYPHVPQTASINGFADPIYSSLPDCAHECVKLSTGNTPCPYWDTGCLCVMPQWIDPVADCIASKCAGNDVVKATSLANSICTKVGAWYSLAASDVSLLKDAENRAASTTKASASTGKAVAAAATSTVPKKSKPTQAAAAGNSDDTSKSAAATPSSKAEAKGESTAAKEAAQTEKTAGSNGAAKSKEAKPSPTGKGPKSSSGGNAKSGGTKGSPRIAPSNGANTVSVVAIGAVLGAVVAYL